MLLEVAVKKFRKFPDKYKKYSVYITVRNKNPRRVCEHGLSITLQTENPRPVGARFSGSLLLVSSMAVGKCNSQ